MFTNKKQYKQETDSVTVITNYYYVTIENNQYKIVNDKINNEAFNRIIFWNKRTKTNYIIDFTGDFYSVMDFIDSDDNFKDNISEIVGCKFNELEEINSPMVVYIIPERG